MNLLDERFLLHRYKSTSHAAVVGGLLMGGWFLYERLARGQVRLDILVIMMAMAITKVGFLIYYRLRD